MQFQDKVHAVALKMLSDMTERASHKYQGDQILAEVTSEALQQYSLLFMFIHENSLHGDYFEWISGKQTDLAYGTESE